MRTADQVRADFLGYFEGRGHRVVRSSSLVPQNDPTLLFANAGMNQFKDVFLGRERREYTRATSAQKCVRAGGKHNDLENVGHTARHHTFFEMLGNFSFGDYFKEEAIAYAWEFLTGELRLPKDRLKVTIFKGEEGIPRDAEAHGFWKAHVSPERILELGAKDNFWSMGDVGPCGPCSEVHFFQGDALPCPEEDAGKTCRGVECECDRWLEIWNLVFMQFDRGKDGALSPLPAPCVDTGMGLERIAAVVQGKLSNYDSDLFAPLLLALGSRAGVFYGKDPGKDPSFRVIADHLRAMTFLIADGVMPGNEGRGYVLRKIMRRAMRHAKRLSIELPFLHTMTGLVVERMALAYPELLTHAETVSRVVRFEEERFSTTLRQAFQIFEEVAEKAKPAGRIPGSEVFRLYDTYGLPLDFTEELARERGLLVDQQGFEKELKAQQERARQASRMGAVTGDPVHLSLLQAGKTLFEGHAALLLEGPRVLAVLKGGVLAPRLESGEQGEIILDRTPFYAKSGGQVGDHGQITAPGSRAEVVDVTLPVPGLFAHHVRVTAGGFERGMIITAEVDPRLRSGAARNHTGTHLLHAALRELLGPHVKQAGSEVAPDRLRFDFSHYAGVSPRELRHIENRVNAEILADKPLETKVMGREEALAYGALAFFGDKYGEQVRVVEVPGFSKEFCGGTHVLRTSEIGLFLFTGEQGISAGTRRVLALTGEDAMARAQEDQGILEELEETAKVSRRSLVDEYARLREQLKSKEREVQSLKLRLATAAPVAGEGQETEEIAGARVWIPRFEGLDKKAHAAVVDEFRNRNRDRPFVLFSTAVEGEGVHVISAVSESLKGRVAAPEILKRLGLRGGGRPDFAQGGGVTPGDLDSLREKAAGVMREMLEGPGAA
jgi:alanyl-tRNA synthetase